MSQLPLRSKRRVIQNSILDSLGSFFDRLWWCCLAIVDTDENPCEREKVHQFRSPWQRPPCSMAHSKHRLWAKWQPHPFPRSPQNCRKGTAHVSSRPSASSTRHPLFPRRSRCRLTDLPALELDCDRHVRGWFSPQEDFAHE